MILQTLLVLEQGLRVIRSNSRLVLVGVLIFVFPLLFIWITQSFFNTAYTNIQTAEKQRIGALHDALAVLLQSNQYATTTVDVLIREYLDENNDITKFRVAEQVGGDIRIVSASEASLVGTIEESSDLYLASLTSPDNSLIFEFNINDVRTWQVFRAVTIGPRESLFIFSEHSFANIDSIMLARRQESYIGLTVIFLFLIALAYWLARQMHWQAEFQALSKQLHERDLFSNMIAHEFRSPLTAIKGYASFLEDSKNLSADEHRFAGNIKLSAERLVSLVSDFLEVARIQSGNMALEKVTTDVRVIVERVVSDMQPVAKGKDLILVAELPKAEVSFETDTNRLTQVITNIVSNALKYTESGTVTVSLEQNRVETVIRVKDTGMGIAADDQKKLFTPFMRVGGVDSSKVTGTGLGMWITKQLVELLGGTIGIESIKGVGTQVVITFRS